MKHSIQILLGVCLALLPFMGSAQNNLLQNHYCDFHESDPVWLDDPAISTQYTYTTAYMGLGGDGGAGKMIVTAQASNQNSSYFTCTGHSGPNTDKFLAVNGFGGTGTYTNPNGTPSNKRIIQYTINNVFPDVYYDFSFYATYLTAPTQYGFSVGVKFRVQYKNNNGSYTNAVYGNNQSVWEPEYVSNQAYWSHSPNFRCKSNSNGILTIAILDDCAISSGWGDDFGIDDVSLVMADDYIVNANPISFGSPCICEYDDGIYVFTLPNGANGYQCYFETTNYTPDFYLKDVDGTWKQPTQQSPITTSHGGTAWLDNNHRLHYLPASNYYNTESIQYRVSKWGMNAQSTITFSVRNLPSFVEMNSNTWPNEDRLCLSGLSSFNPTAVWNENGGSLFWQGWEWRREQDPDNDSYWHESTTFANQGVGNYYIRFGASNSCTDNCEIPVVSPNMLLHVCDEPVLDNHTIPAPPTLCGPDASLSDYISQNPIGVNWKNNQGTARWEVSHNGGTSWVALTETDLQDGDLLRYHATNSCGADETNHVTITKSLNGVEFTQNTQPLAQDEFCIEDVISTSIFPQHPSYNDHGLTIQQQYWAYSVDGENYSPMPSNLTFTQAGTYWFCYQLKYPCGSGMGTANSSPVSVTVFDVPSITVPDPLPMLDTVCDGTPFEPLLPSGFAPAEGSHVVESGWEISASTSPTNFSSDLPDTLHVSDNGRWIRYYAEGCVAPATGAPIQLHVGSKPTLNTIEVHVSSGFCDQTEVDELVAQGKLTDVHVTGWNLFEAPDDPEDPSYERWEVYYGGNWIPLELVSTNYNGCVIRYHAHNQCGDTYAELAEGAITVTSGPSFTNNNIYQSLESYYCVTNTEPLQLPAITPQDYDAHGLLNVTAYWAWAEEENGTYEPVSGNLSLTENRNGFLRCYLYSEDCGAAVPYSTAFPLVIIGQPQIYNLSVNVTEFCEGQRFEYEDLSYSIDWHHGSGDEPLWMFAPSDNLDDVANFNPFFEPLPPGEFRIRCMVENECGSGLSEWSDRITVLERPHITVDDEWPQELELCVNEVLVTYLPYTHAHVFGDIDDEQWLCYDPVTGESLDIIQPVPADCDGYVVRLYVTGCDNSEDWKEFTLRVIDIPNIHQYQLSVPGLLCAGNPLDVYQPLDEELTVEWRRNGQVFAMGSDPFDVGTYQITYRISNRCGWSDFSDSYELVVTPGPSFNYPSTWQEPIVVCNGLAIGEDELPALSAFINNLGENDSPLGWYLRSPEGDYQPWSLQNPVNSRQDGFALCYGIRSDCQGDEPLYSTGKTIRVIDTPVIDDAMDGITSIFCEGDAAHFDDLNLESSEYDDLETHWEMRLKGSFDWVALPQVWSRELHDEAEVRYHVESKRCNTPPVLSDPLTIFVNAQPVVEALPESIQLCAEGSLSLEPAVYWNQPYPGTGEWQVSANGTSGWTNNNFDPQQVSEDFDGWYARYHVVGDCGYADSPSMKLSLLHSADVAIVGNELVAQMNSFWPGVYYYYTDVVGALTWTLEPPLWEFQDTLIDGKSCCKLVVTSSGHATLTAMVGDGSCGMDVIEINASQFGVEEQQIAVEVYPNPAKQSVTVASEGIDAVVLYNLLGQQVKAVDVQSDEYVSFGVQDLPEALYVVEVRTHKGTARRLLTVTH